MNENKKITALIKENFRYSFCNQTIDFDENFDEILWAIAERCGLSADYIWYRYKQFIKFTNYGKYINKTPILHQMWKSFLEYENGGPIDREHFDIDELFREPLYDSAICEYLDSIY